MTFCIFVHNLLLNLLYKIVGWSKRISYWRRDNCKVYIETIICIHLLYNISQKIYVYSSNKSLMSSEFLLSNEWKRQFLVVIRGTLYTNIFLSLLAAQIICFLLIIQSNLFIISCTLSYIYSQYMFIHYVHILHRLYCF